VIVIVMPVIVVVMPVVFVIMSMIVVIVTMIIVVVIFVRSLRGVVFSVFGFRLRFDGFVIKVHYALPRIVLPIQSANIQI